MKNEMVFSGGQPDFSIFASQRHPATNKQTTVQQFSVTRICLWPYGLDYTLIVHRAHAHVSPMIAQTSFRRFVVTRFMLSVCAVLLMTSVVPAQIISTQITTHAENQQRSLTYYLPAGLGAHPPLVLCYHGSGGTSAGVMQSTGLNALADRYKFVVCYPQAITIGSDVQWNVYVDTKPGHGGVGDLNAPDDVAFTADVISFLQQQHSIDTKRVFATGISNGGFMCYMLAVFMPDVISAVAPVAANMWGEDAYLQQYFGGAAFTSIRVMHSHGTADPEVDYPDKNNNPDDFIYPLASFSARMCSNTRYTVHNISANIDKLVFCTAPNDVILIRQKGLGHAWSLPEYDLSAEIIRFFGLADASASDVDETQPEQPMILPQPADESFSIMRGAHDNTTLVRVYNTMGQCVVELSEHHVSESIDVRSLPVGTYRVEWTSARQLRTSMLIIAR